MAIAAQKSIDKKVETTAVPISKSPEIKAVPISRKVEAFEDYKRSGITGKALRDKFSKEELKAIYAYYSDRDSQMVTGKFKYYDVPGGSVEFFYRKWPKDKVKHYIMYDEHVYTIPIGVARHLSNNCATPVHEYTVDKSSKGQPTVNMEATPPRGNFVKGLKIVSKKHRMGFISTDFTLDMDLLGRQQEKQIVTAEIL